MKGPEILGGAEREPVGAGRQPVRSDGADAAVGVGAGAADLLRAGAGDPVEPDRDAGRGHAPGGVEHVGGDRGALRRCRADVPQQPAQPDPVDLPQLAAHRLPLGGGVVTQPLPQQREQFPAAAAGRADQVDVAEPALVGLVAVGQGLPRGRVGGLGPGLFPARSAARRPVRAADPRMAGQRLLQVGLGQPGHGRVGAGEDLVGRGVRAARIDLGRPAPRRAAGQQVLAGGGGGERVEGVQAGPLR